MSNREKSKLKSKITAEILSDEPRIEIIGNREIIIDGCRGVVEYDENSIKLCLNKSILTLTGDRLVINSFDGYMAIISGVIFDISFTL